MKGSFQIARIKGIKISIHWSFFILLLWIAFSTMNEKGSATDVVYELAFILSIFFCVLLHELGHALTAARYHIVTRDITLLPIGGVARLERMPEDPKQELYVAIAGPLVNVAIVFVLLVIVLLGKGFPLALDLQKFEENSFLTNLLLVNISLIVFNLLPAFPMDGGRVLRAFLSMKWSREKATRIAATLGQSVAVLFIIGGLFFNPFLILIGFFVFMGAQTEYKMVLQQGVFRNLRVSNLMMKEFKILVLSNTFQDAVNALLAGYVTDFLVFENGAAVGYIVRDEILRGYAEHGPDKKIEIAVRPLAYTVNVDDALDKVWSRMIEFDMPLVPVYLNAEIIGILTKENVSEYMALHLMQKENN